MTDLRTGTLRLTTVLLATSFVLIGPSLLGVGGSLLLAGGLAAVAAVLFAARDSLPLSDDVYGHDISVYVGDLWVGPALGSLVVLVFLGASPGELQALGGLAGAAGMGNYFLRPVYLMGASLFRRVA